MIKKIKTFRIFSKNSVYRRSFVYSFAIVIIPFLITLCALMFFYSYRNSNNERIALVNDCIKSSAELETAMNAADNIYTQYSANAEIVKLLKSEYNDLSYMHANAEVYNMFKTTINISSNIESIYLYDVKREYVYSSRNGNSIKEFSDTSWYDYYMMKKSNNFMVYSDAGSNILSRAYQLFEYEDLIGILVINIKIDDSNNVTVLDSDGIPLYGYGGEYTITDPERFSNTDVRSIAYFKNKGVGEVLSDIDSMYLVSVQKEYKSNAALLLFIVIFSALISLCISTFFAFLHTNYYYNSIASIIMQIKENSLVPIHIQSIGNEFDFIKETICDIMVQNSNMQDELIEKMIEVNSMQAAALQSQINPHFLFNTLNLINGLIIEQTGDDCEATILIALLSEMFEFIMESKNIIPLANEIEYAKKYIEIEMIKKNRSFDVEWHIDTEAESCNVIKMILQPIIENAISYGIRGLTDRRGRVTINIFKDRDNLVISVHDNGNTISGDDLEKIKSLLNGKKFEGEKHIGLSNVNKRIQLICGDVYGCEFNSDENGTECTIRMPFDFV